MISFQDTAIAFAHKSDRDLRKARLLFRIVGNPGLMKIGKVLTLVALALRIPIKWAVKATLFKQFCGGENIGESHRSVNQLAEYGVGSILDYSVEGQTEESDFEAATAEIISTINYAQGKFHLPFCVFKVTGIARNALLEKANTGETLNSREQAEFDKILNRIDRMCARAHETGTSLLIDAEESWIQNPIDDAVQQMMRKYNKARAIVYNTIQLYRHDRLAFMEKSIADAREHGYKIGLKLVRGAYMEKERERAEEFGYPSPIQPTKAAADRDYNEALKLCVANIDCVALCAGTHNEESSEKLSELMREHNLENSDKRIYFSQLFGMGDHISFNLAKRGYNVAKYVPYGPVRKLLPYLIRRAEENTSTAGQSGRELSLIHKEILRRKTAKA